MRYKLLRFLLLVTFSNSWAAVQNTELAESLGWINTSPVENLCGGYYLEPNLNPENVPLLPLKESNTDITADSGVFSQKGTSTLEGNVVIVQPGRRLLADRAIIYRNPVTFQATSVDLIGHVKAYEKGRLVVGEKAHFLLNEKKGNLRNVTFRVMLTNEANQIIPQCQMQGNNIRIDQPVAWGQASSAEQISATLNKYENVTYTSCPPLKGETASPWNLKAESILINKETGRGEARNVKLLVRDVPVFYTPYFNFPVDDRRKTGFLFPTMGYTNESGVNLGIPFYLNIAPNYDATLTPTFFSERGVLFDNLFRYMTSSTEGEFDFSINPYDAKFKRFKESAPAEYPNEFGLKDLMNAKNTRYLINWKSHTILSPRWSTGWHYLNVSDDYFLDDYSNTPQGISLNQLPQRFYVNYIDEHWRFLGQFENYQTLHQVDRQPLDNLYSRLPQLLLVGDYPNLWETIDVNAEMEAVYFTRSQGPFESVQPLQVSRARFQPTITLPFAWSWGFFKPAFRLHAADYNHENEFFNSGDPAHLTVPMFSVDSGLYFDRDFKCSGVNYQQTLEPRIFYLFVPFEEQNQIPKLDTGIIPFSYDQLFRWNRFSGYDRVGDTNQVSFGLTSRIFNPDTGQEKLTASIGQILYFQKRRVTLCDTLDCIDTVSGIGGVSNSDLISPLATQLTYFIQPVLSAHADTAWDIVNNEAINNNLYLQYQPETKKIFNIGYYFLKNGDVVVLPPRTGDLLGPVPIPALNSSDDLHQLGTSFSWPITSKLSTVGMFNYNISHNHPQTFLFGLQYENCCWAMRFVGGRTFSVLDQLGKPRFHNSFYVQFQLKGLGNFGTNSVSNLLMNNIPGYQDPFTRRYKFMR